MARTFTTKARLEAQDRFLARYAETGVITGSAEHAGVSRDLIYHWQEHDETFSFRFNLAKEAYCDAIRAEIHRRAIEGVEKPVYKDGKLIETLRQYSDVLLIFHAKAKMSEYRTDAPAQAPTQKAYVGFDPELV